MQVPALANENIPAAHVVALVLPVGQKEPAGHCVHASDVTPVAAEYVPAEQGSGELAPCKQ